jgi:hypothetical protein
MGRVRQALAERGILQERDVAPLEMMTLGDLDIAEGVIEEMGVTLPELLNAKSSSTFHADSLKNYLVSGSSYEPTRPTRVKEATDRFFQLALRQLGWVESAHPRD